MGECPPLPSPDLGKQSNRSTSDTPRSGMNRFLALAIHIIAEFLFQLYICFLHRSATTAAEKVAN